MAQRYRLTQAEITIAVLDCAVLAAACLLAFWLVMGLLLQLYFLSRADSLLGGMWAVIATVFVFWDSYAEHGRRAVPDGGHLGQLRAVPDLPGPAAFSPGPWRCLSASAPWWSS